METTFVLDDGAKAQLGDELVPQIVGTDGVTYRVVVAQGNTDSGPGGQGLHLVGDNEITYQNGDLPPQSTPIYVVMNDTELPTSQARVIVPPKNDRGARVPKTARDAKRRATHNEVERRRRDKINLGIGKLSRIIPDCQSEMTAATATKAQSLQSKGGILNKACAYITELKKKADERDAMAKEVLALKTELGELRHKFDAVSQENVVFREALAQAGLHINVLRGDIKMEESNSQLGNGESTTFTECTIDD